MGKKYKLTSLDNQNQKGGVWFPNWMGTQQSNIVMGPPIGPNIGINQNGDQVMRFPLDGNNYSAVFPPHYRGGIDDFIGLVSSSTPSKSANGKPEVKMTFQKAAPKQSFMMLQPTSGLPQIASSFGFNIPVGYQANPVVINPNESEEKLMLSSTDPKTDNLTIKGVNGHGVEDIYKNLELINSVRVAHEKVEEAKKKWSAVNTVDANTGRVAINFDPDLKNKTEQVVKGIGGIKQEQIEAAINLNKALDELKEAKKKAKTRGTNYVNMNDTNDVIDTTDLLSLEDMVDETAIKQFIKDKFGFDENEFEVKTSKKNNNYFNLFGLIGLPVNGYSPYFTNRLNNVYGPRMFQTP